MRARTNLTVLPHAHVRELALSGTRVTGVSAHINGRPATLSAGLILLSAGAIDSTLLLMRSGVGPAESLKRAGVECRADHPGVGENLHDHLLTAGNVYRTQKTLPPSRLQHSESMTYLDSGDLSRTAGVPDVVVGCVAAPVVTECFERPESGTAFTLLSGVAHPTSRGRIALSGPGVGDAPLIDPAYLTTEHDRRLARRALELARMIGRQTALDEWRARRSIRASIAGAMPISMRFCSARSGPIITRWAPAAWAPRPAAWWMRI